MKFCKPLGIGFFLLAWGMAAYLFEDLSQDVLFETPYFQTTLKRIEELEPSVAEGSLMAGWGRATLTPQWVGSSQTQELGVFKALPLAGYGARKGRPATGVHDPLWVKALALRVGDQTGVLVSMDALIVPSEVSQGVVRQCQERYGWDRSRIYFSATHTHAGIGGWGRRAVGEMFAGEFNPEVLVWWERQVMEAISIAVESLQPAEWSHERFSAPEYVRNRLVGSLGEIDSEFSFLGVKQVGGGSCVVGQFSAHPTLISSGVMEFSGGYPGVWQREMENRTGGMAIFCAGAVGSHSARISEAGWEGVEHLGKALADLTLDHWPDEDRWKEAVQWQTAAVAMELPPMQIRLFDEICLNDDVARFFLPVPDSAWFQLWRLDEVVWFSSPGDFSGELSMELKRYCSDLSLTAQVTSFNGDYIGYLIPSRYYFMNSYESQTMGFWGPCMGDYCMDILFRLTRRSKNEDSQGAGF